MLRTVTFSDPKVAEAVNANFVCAWHNRSPGFINPDFQAEEAIFKGSAEAFPTKNICTFVMTPEGRVFHYVAGYLSPELFLRFIDTALALRRAAFDEKMNLKDGGRATLRSLHGQWADEGVAESQNPKIAPCWEREYRGMRHEHTQACQWRVRSFLVYLIRVHRWWSQAAELPELKSVRFKYLYGNDFSQEGPGAATIEQDPAVGIRR